MSELSSVSMCGTAQHILQGPGFIYRRADRKENTYNYFTVMLPCRSLSGTAEHLLTLQIDGSSTMHRADLVQVLLNNVPQSYPIHFDKRLTTYTEVIGDDGRIDHYVLHFADGTTAEADVIIGADGIKSRVRMSMYDIAHRQDCSPNVEREHCPRCSAATPKWTGIITYRALIPTDSLRKINPEHRAFRYTLCVSIVLRVWREGPLILTLFAARCLLPVLRKV